MRDLTMLTTETSKFKREKSLTDMTWFSQGVASTSLFTNDSQIVSHLQRYLYSYSTNPVLDPNWCIEVWVGFPVASIEGVFRGVHAFSIESGKTVSVLVNAEDRWYWVPQRTTLVKVNVQSCKVELYCQDYFYGRSVAHDIVRQIVTDQLFQQRYVLFHSAAVAIKDKGILIAGFKGQGKTSTTIALLRNLEADYISNDQVLLGYNDKRIIARSCPMSIKVGLGTLLQYEDLADLIPSELTKEFAHTPGDLRKDYFQKKIKIDKKDLVTGGEFRSDCYPSIMLCPTLDFTVDSTFIRYIEPEEIKSLLINTNMFMDKHHTYWLGLAEQNRLDRDKLDMIMGISNQVLCYELISNGDVEGIVKCVRKIIE